MVPGLKRVQSQQHNFLQTQFGIPSVGRHWSWKIRKAGIGACLMEAGQLSFNPKKDILQLLFYVRVAEVVRGHGWAPPKFALGRKF